MDTTLHSILINILTTEYLTQMHLNINSLIPILAFMNMETTLKLMRLYKTGIGEQMGDFENLLYLKSNTMFERTIRFVIGPN